MSAFDGLQRAQFSGFEFPVSSCTVTGGLRDHVHEYPHSPGGAPEKLGRKLYEIKFSVPMHATLTSYKDMWPAQMDALRQVFEYGLTDDLTIPTIGTIKAYATSWSEHSDSKRRSGVDAEFTFREDQSGLFLTDALVKAGTTSLVQKIADLVILAAKVPEKNLFDSLADAANALASISDQAELYGNQIQAKAAGVASMCNKLDSGVKTLSQPVNHALLDALHDVWDSAVQLGKDALKKATPTIDFTTTAEMSIASVSTAIYGDSSRAAELLQMNAVNDAFAIPPGTKLKAYAPAA